MDDNTPFREKISPIAAVMKRDGVHRQQQDESRRNWSKPKSKRAKRKTLRTHRG